MRRLMLDDILRAALALGTVPRAVQRSVMLDWLDRAHCADKARKRGVFVGPGDLASVLPNHTGPCYWTGSEAQLQQLEAVLTAIARWKRARRLG